MVSPCRLCPRRCVEHNRSSFCGAEDIARCYRHRVEYSEETCISPSHLFYLSGCNLRCRFCIGEESAITPTLGQPLTQPFFAEAIAWGRTQGAKNIQWVGGEPGIHLDAICRLMQQTHDLPPVVWKSNFYFTPTVFETLWDYVETFVADFKFGNSRCAESLCGVTNYVETVTAALLTVYRRNPRSLIVRHLLLPQHFDCCFLPVLDWFGNNIPEAMFSLLTGYLPAWQAKEDMLLRALPDQKVASIARKLIKQRNLRLA